MWLNPAWKECLSQGWGRGEVHSGGRGMGTDDDVVDTDGYYY